MFEKSQAGKSGNYLERKDYLEKKYPRLSRQLKKTRSKHQLRRTKISKPDESFYWSFQQKRKKHEN